METNPQQPKSETPTASPGVPLTQAMDDLWCWLVEDQRGSEVLCAGPIGGELSAFVFPKRDMATSGAVTRSIDLLRKASPGRAVRLVHFKRLEIDDTEAKTA